MFEMSSPIRIGDDVALHALVPLAAGMPVAKERGWCWPRTESKECFAFDPRGPRQLGPVRTSLPLYEVRPRTGCDAFEADGASRGRIDRRVTRDISVTSTQAVGTDTAVIGLVIVTGQERGLVATCVRDIAVEPSERGGGLVFHAINLRRAEL